jgi:hypothetical protein
MREPAERRLRSSLEPIRGRGERDGDSLPRLPGCHIRLGDFRRWPKLAEAWVCPTEYLIVKRRRLSPSDPRWNRRRGDGRKPDPRTSTRRTVAGRLSFHGPRQRNLPGPHLRACVAKPPAAPANRRAPNRSQVLAWASLCGRRGRRIVDRRGWRFWPRDRCRCRGIDQRRPVGSGGGTGGVPGGGFGVGL